jgi:TolB-like protein/class 3 adenylate cyclase
MPENRILAAIMFTDIVGYTKIMGSDEAKAVDMLSRNRSIHQSCIEKFNGTLIKEIGDGNLVRFPLASDAVHCAMEIQKECAKHDIPLKIGIHEGELMIEGADVVGDVVNIASRLQENTLKGYISISGKVYSDIKNRIDIQTRLVGERSFKNVDEPIMVYNVIYEGEQEDQPNQIEKHKNAKSKLTNYIFFATAILIIAAFVIWKFVQPKEVSKLEKSIAVLPFKDLSAEMNNQYFCDGIMEGVLNHLCRIKDLRVAGRTSTEKYRETSLQIPQIGDELNVNYLLEASVFKSDEKIRVTAQLINASSDEHLWSGQYDMELSDVFVVMNEIATEVASKVQVVIAPDVKERMGYKPTDNLEVYNIYLKGRAFHSKHRLDTEDYLQVENAIKLYRQALEIDPQFALAYIWLGKAVFDLNIWTDFFTGTYADTLKYFADMALSINPYLEEGYWLRGHYYYEKGKYDKSIEQLNRAIELNQNYGDAYMALGSNYASKNDPINTIINYKKAQRLKTGNSDYHNVLKSIGTSYHSLLYYEKAEAAYDELVKYNPKEGYRHLYVLSLHRGEWDKMKLYGEKICAIDSGSMCLHFLYTWSYYTKDFLCAVENYKNIRKNISVEDTLDLIRSVKYAFVLYNLDQKKEARKIFDQQIAYHQESIRKNSFLSTGSWGGSSQHTLAAIHAFLGDKEKAYQYLYDMEKYAFSGWYTMKTQVDPMFESLWENEEFKALLQREEIKFARIRAELERIEEEGNL